MNTIKKSIVAAIFLIGTPAAAIADEVWYSDWGTVTYQKDVGSTAIWSFDGNGPVGAGAGLGAGNMFLLELGSVFKNRATDRPYRGFWMVNDGKELCASPVPDLDGKESRNYGTIEVTFLDSNFPVRWRASWEFCTAPPAREINATPRVSGGWQLVLAHAQGV